MELCENWLMGIGLQKVDNLRISGDLLDLALQNIKGEIDYPELERRLTEYHKNKFRREKNKMINIRKFRSRIMGISRPTACRG